MQVSTDQKSKWPATCKSYETCGKESQVSLTICGDQRLANLLPVEFHLVAGGEELFSDSGLLGTVKTEDPSDSSGLITLDIEQGDAAPSLSPSPPTSGCSPGDFDFESPSHSPPQPSSATFQTYPATSFPMEPHHAHPPSPSQHVVQNVLLSSSPVTRLPPPSTFGFEHRDVQQTSARAPFNMEYPANPFLPLTVGTSCEPANAVHNIAKLESPANRTRFFDQAPSATVTQRSILPPLTCPPTNKLSSLCLWADGMQPYNLSVDSLRTTSLRPLSPVALQIKLYLPSINDIHSMPTLHGFHGTVTFNISWSASVRCITKVYAEKTCVSEEAETLQLVVSSSSTRDNCQMTGFLPSESSLSRSRWLDASTRSAHVSMRVTVC
jgi:hypothetical protein